MGKGQPVASAYILMRDGSPQPTTQMKVVRGRERRASLVIEAESVRR